MVVLGEPKDGPTFIDLRGDYNQGFTNLTELTITGTGGTIVPTVFGGEGPQVVFDNIYIKVCEEAEC